MYWFFFGFLAYYAVLLAERAVVGIAAFELERLRGQSGWRAKHSYRLATEVRTTLAALLLARVFLKILIVVFAVQVLTRNEVLRTGFQDLGLSGTLVWSIALGLLVLVLALLFWGIKRWRNPVLDSGNTGIWLQRLTPFVLCWTTLFRPFLRSEAASKLPPSDVQPDRRTTSGRPVATPSDDHRQDIELLKSIVKFGDATVRQIMQPRAKVVALSAEATFAEVLRTVREAGFSRIPVYEEDLDNVVGILYVKDLVPHLDKPDNLDWLALLRTNVLVVPEAKPAVELLREFKQNRQHIAVVVDEHGCCSGIVTLEDVLEEITGEIRDEFDTDNEVRYRRLDDRSFLFEGQALLNDVCRIARLDPEVFDAAKGNAETLAGLVLERTGDIPAPGIVIDLGDYRLTVLAADERKIGYLKLTITA